MREIKFRAYDTKEKKFDIFDHYQDFATFHYYQETPNIIEGKPMNQNLILQQFTGLKDKNGKEIYEGDIVKYRKLNRPDDGLKYGLSLALEKQYTVEYKFCGFLPFSGWVDNEDLEWEVIGNIYENPELLKK